MDYNNSTGKIKCWYIHKKKLKYCLSDKLDEHNNKLGKGWLPGSSFTNGTDIMPFRH